MEELDEMERYFSTTELALIVMILAACISVVALIGFPILGIAYVYVLLSKRLAAFIRLLHRQYHR